MRYAETLVHSNNAEEIIRFIQDASTAEIVEFTKACKQLDPDKPPREILEIAEHLGRLDLEMPEVFQDKLCHVTAYIYTLLQWSRDIPPEKEALKEHLGAILSEDYESEGASFLPEEYIGDEGATIELWRMTLLYELFSKKPPKKDTVTKKLQMLSDCLIDTELQNILSFNMPPNKLIGLQMRLMDLTTRAGEIEYPYFSNERLGIAVRDVMLRHDYKPTKGKDGLFKRTLAAIGDEVNRKTNSKKVVVSSLSKK